MRQLILLLMLMIISPLASTQDIGFSNAQLTERSGETIGFRKEAIGDHIVVIGFTWGGCTTVCPITDRIMADVHEKMGERLGSARLLTITLDPFGDSPESLAKRAKELGAGPHWLWLGGDFRNVEQVLAGLGASAPILDKHPPFFLIVDGRSGALVRKAGLPPSQELIAAVDTMFAARAKR